MRRAFEGQTKAAKDILAALRDEAQQLRRMLARAAVDAGASATGAGGPGGEAARRAAVLRQVEAELAARALHERHMARREADVMQSLRDIAECMRPRPTVAAGRVVQELVSVAGVLGLGGAGGGDANDDDDDGLFGDGGEGGEGKVAEDGELGGAASAAAAGPAAGAAGGDGLVRTVADELAAVKRLQPSDSSQEDALLRSVRRARDAIDAMATSVEDEERRRAEGVTLWRQAAGAGVLEGPGANREVRRAIEQFEASQDPVVGAQQRLLEGLLAFAGGATAYEAAERQTLRTFVQELARAVEQQNPAVAKRVRAGAKEGLGRLYVQLFEAVAALLGRAPGDQNRLGAVRTTQDRAARTARHAVAQARRAAEEEAARARLSKEGAEALAERVSELIEKARKGEYAGEDARRRLLGLPPRGEDEGEQDLAKRIEEEAQKEVKEIEDRLEQEKQRREEEAALRDAEARDQMEQQLAASNLDEEEQQRLRAEFEKDRAQMLEAL